MAKRWLDLTVSALGLVVLSPLLCVVAALVKLDSAGPVFYRGWRVGEREHLFRIFKFRTMVRNAEELRHLVEWKDENGNIVHKSKNDPRITRVGRFLRRTSIDELPQFFNVLQGTMSLVGPRPELPYLVEWYQPWQRKRRARAAIERLSAFAVPGCTGHEWSCQ